MPCRSCAAAFAQYLEDQGGFPLFTIEGGLRSWGHGRFNSEIIDITRRPIRMYRAHVLKLLPVQGQAL